MIIFDCERLRTPFNGFYSYSYNLAVALLEESARRSEAIGLYIHKRNKDLIPGDYYRRYRNKLHKKCLLLPRSVRLWHSSNQFSAYLPFNRRIPVLTTIHDLNYLYSDADIHLNHAGRTAAAISRADRIVTISQYVKKDILEHFDIDESKVSVIYNGVGRYEGGVQAPEKKPDGPFLLYVGRVDKTKNVKVLPALLEGNDYRLVIAGRYNSFPEDIMEEARRWKVADRIELTGPVSEEVKHWYMQNCEAFLMPSLAEGFGIPMLEAMQYHKPVFSSCRTSLPEVAGDCAFYFNYDFEPRAMQQEFAAGMQAFSKGAITPEMMDARLAMFTWERAAREYYDLYEEIVQA